MKKNIGILLLILSLLLVGCGAEKEDVIFYKTETIRTFFGASSTREVNEYDEEWNLIHTTTYQDGAEVSQVNYEYTDIGYRMVGTQNGVEETLEFILTKDDHGNPLHTEQYLNGELYNTSDCTYDEKGNMLTQESTIPMANMTVRLEMEYDENGNRVKTVQDNGFDIGTTTYTYDKNGKLLTETYHTKAGDSTSVTEYSYFEDGLTQTAMIYESDGNYSGKRVTTYDEAGNMLLQETYDAEDQLMMTTACSYIGTDGTISSGIESEG